MHIKSRIVSYTAPRISEKGKEGLLVEGRFYNAGGKSNGFMRWCMNGFVNKKLVVIVDMNKQSVAVLLVLMIALLTATKVTAESFRVSSNIKTSNTNDDVTQIYRFVEFNKDLSEYEIYPWEMNKIAKFKKAYSKLFAKHQNDKWVVNLYGPSRKNRLIECLKNKYVVIKTCKPHECDTNKLVVLFDLNNNSIIAVLVRDNTAKYYGNASDQLKDVLIDLLNK